MLVYFYFWWVFFHSTNRNGRSSKACSSYETVGVCEVLRLGMVIIYIGTNISGVLCIDLLSISISGLRYSLQLPPGLSNVFLVIFPKVFFV
jgi:hypothetical protein